MQAAFAFIDGWWLWVEMVAFFVLGVWAGRRWALTKMQSECRARNCKTIQKMRQDKMKLAADNLTLEHRNAFMREVVTAKTELIHSLRTSNGKMGREIEKLTQQLPRPQRRMVA